MDSYYKLRHGLWQIAIVITVQSTIELLQCTTGIKFLKYQLIIMMIIIVIRVGLHTHVRGSCYCTVRKLAFYFKLLRQLLLQSAIGIKTKWGNIATNVRQVLENLTVMHSSVLVWILLTICAERLFPIWPNFPIWLQLLRRKHYLVRFCC